MPLHQMPAASPGPERLADDTQVKTIQPKVDARPCRAGTHAYAVARSPLRPSRRSTNPTDSPTTTSPSPASSPYEVYAPRADERHATDRPRADGVCAAGAPPGPCLARHAWPKLPTHPCVCCYSSALQSASPLPVLASSPASDLAPSP